VVSSALEWRRPVSVRADGTYVTDSVLSDASLNLVECVDDAAEFMRWLGERREDDLLGIDTESGGLNPWKHRLRMVQFGDRHTGWAIPWERWGGVALEAIRKYQGSWVAHNVPHDWKFLSLRAGVNLPWERAHDTLSLARIDNPARDNRQKPLATKVVDKNASAGQKALEDGMAAHGWTWDTVPIDYPPYWLYAALDPVEAMHLHDYLSPRVMASASQAYSLEREANRICTNMMLKGMQLDVPYVKHAISEYARAGEQIRGWLKSAHGITSPKSGGQIRRALEKLGQEIVYWTDNGAPQFDKHALAFYQHQGVNPAVRQLVEYIKAVRHIEDLSTRYLENFLTLRDINDLIHCSINVMGARTGRMSVSDPALQQLPRDDKVIRGSFIPRPGHVFISCDLDQVEMRILAHLTKDPGLIQAFADAERTGVDFFTTLARILYRDPQLMKADPRRTPLKNSMYARAYGSGQENLALTAGVSIAEIIVLENLTDERFPGMAGRMDLLESEARAAFRRGDRGGVLLDSGRFLPCDPGKEYASLNYEIQGTAAEFMKVGLSNIDAAGLGEYLILPVHDEALLEVPTGMAEEALRVVEECMTDRTKYAVPITAGGAIMRERWTKSA